MTHRAVQVWGVGIAIQISFDIYRTCPFLYFSGVSNNLENTHHCFIIKYIWKSTFFLLSWSLMLLDLAHRLT